MENPRFRPGSDDDAIWNAVYSDAEYGIGDVTGQTILDVGAHIGSFSALALARGAKHVWAFEPDITGFNCLLHNAPAARAYPVAVWRSDRPPTLLSLDRPNEPPEQNPTYGGNSVAYKCCSASVPTVGIPLNTIIEGILLETGAQQVDLLKLDCEGSEFPILLTCTTLEYVKQIICEWHVHLTEFRSGSIVNGIRPYKLEHLTNYLSNLGFKDFNIIRQSEKGDIGTFKTIRCST